MEGLSILAINVGVSQSYMEKLSNKDPEYGGRPSNRLPVQVALVINMENERPSIYIGNTRRLPSDGSTF